MTRTHCASCAAPIGPTPDAPRQTPYDEFDVVGIMKRQSGALIRVKVSFEHFGQPYELCGHCFGYFLAEASEQDQERERLRHVK